jgi:TolB protein
VAALACSGESKSTCRADGACLVFAPSGNDSAQNPCFSPDNGKLLITLWHGGYNLPPAGLFTVPATGGPATAVVDGRGTHVNLPGTSWNAATGRITFASDRDGTNEEVYTARPDGTDLTRVTTHSGPAYIEPSFSPDGADIAFELSPPGGASGEIWKVKASGAGGPIRLTSNAFDKQPNWSPKGNTILFQRFANNLWAIYTMSTDGTGLQRVTAAQDSSTDASWSPGGDRIVYSGSPGGAAGASIFVIPADGSAPPARVTLQPGYDGAVTWSPDGKWLAFESSTNPSGAAPTGIWRIAAPR